MRWRDWMTLNKNWRKKAYSKNIYSNVGKQIFSSIIVSLLVLTSFSVVMYSFSVPTAKAASQYNPPPNIANGDPYHPYDPWDPPVAYVLIDSFSPAYCNWTSSISVTVVASAHGFGCVLTGYVYEWLDLSIPQIKDAAEQGTIPAPDKRGIGVTNGNLSGTLDSFTVNKTSGDGEFILNVQVTGRYGPIYDPHKCYCHRYSGAYQLDTIAPSNPTSIICNGVTNNSWQNSVSAPSFSWSGASDASSGINGYYCYFGDNPSGPNPEEWEKAQATQEKAAKFGGDLSFDGAPISYTTSTTLNPKPYGEGTFYFKIRTRDNISNLAPNWSSAFIFKYDGTSPTTALPKIIAGPEGANGWYLDDVELCVHSNDALSGVVLEKHKTEGGSYNAGSSDDHWIDSSEGIETWYGYAADDAGNVRDAQDSLIIKIDKTDPSTSHSLSGTLGDNGWYTGNVQVTLSSSDAAVSGVSTTKYKINSGSWETYSTPFTVSTEDVNRVYYYSRDNAGNQESANTVEIKIDKTDPSTSHSLSGTLGDNGWYTGNVQVTLSLSSDVSGVSTTKYKINSGSWETYSTPFTVSTEDVNTVYYYSEDNAGHQESTNSVEIKIDKTAPSTPSPDDNNGALRIPKGTILTFTWASVSDGDSGSGIDRYRYKVDDSAEQTGSSGVQIDTSSLSYGEHTFYVRAQDMAGNYGQYGSHSFYINTPPIANFTTNVGETNDPTENFIEIDSGSSIVFNAYSSSDGDGDGLSYQWNMIDVNGGSTFSTSLGTTCEVNKEFRLPGMFRVKLIVGDIYGGSDNKNILIKVVHRLVIAPPAGKNTIHIPWMRPSISSNDLVTSLGLHETDVLKVHTSSGTYSVDVNEADNPISFMVNPGDSVIVVLNNALSAGGIDISLPASSNAVTDVERIYATEVKEPGNIGGYAISTYIGPDTTAYAFGTELCLAVGQLMCKLDQNTGEYSTAFLYGLPFVGEAQSPLNFELHTGDIVAVKCMFTNGATSRTLTMSPSEYTIENTVAV